MSSRLLATKMKNLSVDFKMQELSIRSFLNMKAKLLYYLKKFND